MPLANWHCGISAYRFAWLDVAHHAAFARDPRAGADHQMIADSRLSANHHAVADFGAPGDTDLSTQNGFLTNPNIVADLHEIIDHRSSADDSISGGAAVDRAVRADFNVVLDHDTAELQHAEQALWSGHEAKALTADGDTAFDPDTVADEGVADRRVGADDAVVANDHAGTDNRVKTDVAPRPNLHTG